MTRPWNTSATLSFDNFIKLQDLYVNYPALGIDYYKYSPTFALLMAPIAIQTGRQLGIDPRSLAMGVALATSTAFLTPLGHPVNLLMMSAGGYSFRDYFRVGLPLTILVFLVVMLLLPVFWPLT